MPTGRRWMWGAAGAALLLALAAGWVRLRPAYVYHGSVLDQPAPAPDFTLTDQAGAAFRLSGQAGQVVLLFFGYTSCPDVCPTTLTRLRQVLADLGGSADRVRVALVTVDPATDTPQVLGQYLTAFDPAFVGLTGTPADLLAVYQAYGVYQERETQGVSYTVTHTDRVYVIDARGRLRLTFAGGATATEMAQDVAQLLQEE